MILELLTAAGVVAARSLWPKKQAKHVIPCKDECNTCAQHHGLPLAVMYTENYGDLYLSRRPFSAEDWTIMGVMTVQDYDEIKSRFTIVRETPLGSQILSYKLTPERREALTVRPPPTPMPGPPGKKS